MTYPGDTRTPEQREKDSIANAKYAFAFVGMLYTMCPLVLIGLAVLVHYQDGTLDKLNWPFIKWITPVLLVGFYFSASYIGPWHDEKKPNETTR